MSLVRFLFLFALILATEALAGDLMSELGVLHALINQGQGAAVVGKLEELARQNPGSAEVHGLLGMALMGSADREKVGPQEAQRLVQQGVDELQVAVSLEPRLVEVWGELSAHFEWSGDFEHAAEAKLRQVRLEPDRPEHRLHYIHLLEEAGRSGAVMQALREWVTEQPNSGQAYSALGMHLEKAGKDDEAIAAYRRAVQLRQVDWIPVYLGGLLGKQGRWQEAQEAFAQGCDAIGDVYAMYGRGVAYAKLGKVKLAREMLGHLVKDDEPPRGLIKRLQAVIQDPKIEPVLGLEADTEP